MEKSDFLQPSNSCPVCRARSSIFFEIPDIPAFCNILWSRKSEALNCPRAHLRLAFCPKCALIFNAAYAPNVLDHSCDYEYSLHFSSAFQSYIEGITENLISKYELYNKNIIEIGCGKADFLKLICQKGGNRGFGFDPNYEPEKRNGDADNMVSVIQDTYSERYANYPCDFLCCRHVLDRLLDPVRFLQSIRQMQEKQSNGLAFFEIPNVMFTLKESAIWDITNEHALYFSPASLTVLFERCGYRMLELSEAFGRQFLTVEAQVVNRHLAVDSNVASDVSQVRNLVVNFAGSYKRKFQRWQAYFQAAAAANKKIAIWGCGSKGVTFLNTLKLGEQIPLIVDINPRKQGKFVSGTGQMIVAPHFLQSYRPDVIIVMNPIYLNEIRNSVSGMELTAELLTDDALTDSKVERTAYAA